MDVLKAILERRSVRKYTGEKIGREALLTLMKAGAAAPTSRDTRHFVFIAIDDPATIDRLAAGLPYAKMLLTARHAIIVASDLSVAHGAGTTDYWIQDCCAAAENILIAAKALGLGSCWTAAHPRPERVMFVREALGVPENVMPLCVIAVGKPSGEEKPRDKFDPSKVYWNSFGKTV